MSDNYAKVKSRKYASDDDAENLLAGILDETEDVARAEQARIEAELKAKEDDERRKKELADRTKKEEAAAKLSAEMERLQQVQQRRTEKLEALKIEELKARGEWIDPEEERRKLEAKLQQEADLVAMKEVAEQKARRKAAAEVGGPEVGAAVGPVAVPQKSANMGVIAGIVIALVVALGGGAAAVFGGYQLDQATYSKAVFAPKEQEVALVEKAFTPLPKPEPVVVAEEEPESKGSRRSSGRARVASASKAEKGAPISSKPKENKSSKAASDLEKALNTDVFGGF